MGRARRKQIIAENIRVFTRVTGYLGEIPDTNISTTRALNRFGLICLLASTVLAPVPANAAALKVAISNSVLNYLPEVLERITRTLNQTGYETEIMVLPDKPALYLASRGDIAMDLYRQPTAVADMPGLVVIQPPIQSLTFGMITSRAAPEFCDTSAADFGQMSIVGVLGLRLYEHFFYPKFRAHETVPDFTAAARLLSLRRIDVSFWPREALAGLPEETREHLLVCNTNLKTFNFNSYIHEDYLWARDKIEAAYRAGFSP